MMNFIRFILKSVRVGLSGGPVYRLWLAFLCGLIVWGGINIVEQLQTGLIVTNMRDQVSWGFYIGNFTFLVGVAAAAVLLVIPAYIYKWKPIKEVVVLGEILAISAILMCLFFVTLDIGRPDRFWHLLPFIGGLNFPGSLLAWDTIVLSLYLGLNIVIVTHILYKAYLGQPYWPRFTQILVLLSIPAAISIHTVTAFLYNGLGARPFWNASILAPRFIASAFCSGPAIMVIVFQLLQKTTKFEIKNEAIWKIAELMAYAMFINLFLFGAEIFKEFYSNTEHAVHAKYLFFGVHGHNTLVPYAWVSFFSVLIAFILLLVPSTRRNPITLNIGCLLTYVGVYIEKGMGLVVPGFTPDTLGEIYEYFPSWTEVAVGAGVFAFGFLVFSFLTKNAIAILDGDFRAETVVATARVPEQPATKSDDSAEVEESA